MSAELTTLRAPTAEPPGDLDLRGKDGFFYRLVAAPGKLALHTFERAIRRLDDRTFVPTESLPWVAEVESGWSDVREELETVMGELNRIPNFQDFSEEMAPITQGDNWKTFMLYFYGQPWEQNCQRCPRTAALLERIPGMTTAFFSILAPGGRLTPHRGPYKGVLRYHMGMVVPEPREKCRIRVGDEWAHWEEGRSLVFDDTHEHEVRNETDGPRVVLFVDFVRDLPFPLSIINRALIRMIGRSPFVRNMYENWTKLDGRVDDTAV